MTQRAKPQGGPEKTAGTRQQIVEKADQFFYEQGFEATSFARIAEAISISRGNFYHHFKTKDEILDAVIERRLAATAQMLEDWEHEGRTPTERIQSFINILIRNRAKIMRYGCPVGTLCNELAKLEHASQDHANQLFNLFRRWLKQQFADFGRGDDADTLALHVLARSQGVATLATAFRDEGFIRREVNDLHAWLEMQRPAAKPAATP